MKSTRKISPSEACDRAISRMLPDATESERSYVLYRALKEAGGVNKLMYPQFTTCPHCGKQRLPAEAHNGGRFCRGCRTWFVQQKTVV